MAKRGSEDRVHVAIDNADIAAWVYKPPDDARNWKPADFILWYWIDDEPGNVIVRRPGEVAGARTISCFIEVKDTPNVRSWNPQAEMTQSQRAAAWKAKVMGLRYWVIVWWRKHQRWTISDGTKLLAEQRSVTYREMTSSHGIEVAGPEQLASMLRLVLLDEAGL